MNRNKIKTTLIAAAAAAGALVASVPAAHAQSQSNNMEVVPGPYIGINAGAARLRGDDRPGVPTDRSSTGGKVYGGYNFNPYFALEGGFASTGQFDSSLGNLKGSGLFADAVGRLPFGNGFSGLARLGVLRGKLEDGRTGADLTQTKTTLKGGLGAEYAITRNHAVRAEWERYRFEASDDNKVNTDLYTVGYKYSF